MIKKVIFDFDGTIADTFNLTMELVNSVTGKYGLKPFTQTDIDRLRSLSMREIFAELHIPILKAPLIVNDLKHLLRGEIASEQPIQGIPELLSKLKQHDFSLDIITSNSADTVSFFLEKHNLNYFDDIYSDKSLFGKHIVIQKYLKLHHVDPSQAIYIGDEIRDIEAAHKSNLKIISVTWGFNSEAGLKNYQPDYLAHSPSEIIPIIMGI